MALRASSGRLHYRPSRAANSIGSGFELYSTIGQPEAGVLSGGMFTVSGKFLIGGDVIGPPCLRDLNGDGSVGPLDLAQLLGAWEPCA